MAGSGVLKSVVTHQKVSSANKSESKISVWNLYKRFFIMGAFTFGGGFGIITQMEKEFVVKQQCLTKEELIDFISVGKSLPGIMIINIAIITGYHMKGIKGALACAFGIATPSLITIMILTVLYDKVRDNPYIEKALIGIRAAVIPIIANAVVSLKKTAIKDKMGYAITALGIFLGVVISLQNTILVLTGAVLGLFLAGRAKK